MPYFEFEGLNVFYKITGRGKPLILLHGNTASSKMFSSIVRSFSKHFQIIVPDFPGHGKSQRVERFELDFWQYNARVVLGLINQLGIERIPVIGASGGALVAINLGLEYPDRIEYIIADSFEGEYPLPSYIRSIESDRDTDKKKLMAILFWFYCHGSDWRRIIDLDTKLNIEFAQTGKSFFKKPISELKVPAILTGSKEDEYCNHLDDIYNDLAGKNNALQIKLFEKGDHPALISNKKAFLELAIAKFKS